jgi:hypothetical protein
VDSDLSQILKANVLSRLEFLIVKGNYNLFVLDCEIEVSRNLRLIDIRETKFCGAGRRPPKSFSNVILLANSKSRGEKPMEDLNIVWRFNEYG